MSGPPDLSLWIARLNALGLFEEVGGPLELAAALETGADYGRPRGYVTHGADQVEQEVSSLGGGPLAQDLLATINVVLLVPNYESLGDGGQPELRTIRTAVLASLSHWWPAGCSRGVRFAGGDRISDLAAGQLVWRDDYTIGWQLCQERQA